jgi:hypothetical protein
LEKDTPRKRKFNGSKTRGNGKAFDLIPNLQEKEDFGQIFKKKRDNILPFSSLVDVHVITIHRIPTILE